MWIRAKWLFLGFVLLVMGSHSVVSAENAEWRDQAYNFGSVKFILIKEAKFRNDGFNVSGPNKFNLYPFQKEKVGDMLNSRLNSLSPSRFVTMDYVISQIKGDPDRVAEADPKAPGFQEMVYREMGKHVDLILVLEVRDFGWYYDWREAYYTTEIETERVYYHNENSNGKSSDGWRDIPRKVTKYHPAGYKILDSAALDFRLVDAKTGKDVWKYTDNRTRASFSWTGSYNQSGPEAMMNRIFDEAFKRVPLVARID